MQAAADRRRTMAQGSRVIRRQARYHGTRQLGRETRSVRVKNLKKAAGTSEEWADVTTSHAEALRPSTCRECPRSLHKGAGVGKKLRGKSASRVRSSSSSVRDERGAAGRARGLCGVLVAIMTGKPAAGASAVALRDGAPGAATLAPRPGVGGREAVSSPQLCFRPFRCLW